MVYMSVASVKVQMPLALPAQLVEEITSWSLRLDRSASWLLSAAWSLSRDWVASLSPERAAEEREPIDGGKHPRAWFVPAESMLEICHACERLGLEPEEVVQMAWSFSRPGP
jgi:hypothetical protein